MQENRAKTLDALLVPQTVAVIGASKNPEDLGHAVAANLIAGGFPGTLVLVHPTEPELLGRKCVRELREYRGKVDLVLVAVPVPQLREAVEQALRANVQLMAVLTTLERTVGSPEEDVERQIARLCSSKGVRLLGPNSLGVINLHHGMNASYVRHLPSAGDISVLSQSSALCSAILDWTASRNLGLSKVVALGNKIDLNEMDLLQAFAEDEQTRVLIGYLESIRSGTDFVKAAEALTSVKPVILLKTGYTRAGARAAEAHAGRQNVSDIAYGAAFKRSGVIRADSFQDLLDDARALAQQPLPLGKRVAIVTNAGGPGIMAADAVDNAGLELAELSPATLELLRSRLPASAGLENPVDVLGDADPERYADAVGAVLADEGVDAVMLVLISQARAQPAETARAVVSGLKGNKPGLAAFMGGREIVPARQALVAARVPDYPSPWRAAGALAAMWEYAAWRSRPPRVVTRFPVNRRRVERILRRIQRMGRTQVEEFLAKQTLEAYGFNIPPGQLVTSAAEAVEVAERLGYPVALKIVSPDIVHKSEVGGVRLDLTRADMVRDAFDLIMLHIRREKPLAAIEGVFVEKMCPPGLEVVIGMTRDPRFGPMMMFGVGGIFVEVMEDVAFHLAPITAEEAMQMLRSTRSYQRLEARSERARVDTEGIAIGLQRLSQLATDFPQIEVLEIHPFIVGPIGTEPMAVDASITLRKEALT